MSIDKDKLIKLIDNNLDVVYTDEDMDRLVKVVNEIIKLFTHSTIKEKLYQGIIKRELKYKYEEAKINNHLIATCRYCGCYDQTGEKLIHHKQCHTAQMERLLLL